MASDRLSDGALAITALLCLHMQIAAPATCGSMNDAGAAVGSNPSIEAGKHPAAVTLLWCDYRSADSVYAAVLSCMRWTHTSSRHMFPASGITATRSLQRLIRAAHECRVGHEAARRSHVAQL